MQMTTCVCTGMGYSRGASGTRGDSSQKKTSFSPERPPDPCHSTEKMTPVSEGGEKKVCDWKSGSEQDLGIRRGSTPKASDYEPPPTRLKNERITGEDKGGNVSRADRAKVNTLEQLTGYLCCSSP